MKKSVGNPKQMERIGSRLDCKYESSLLARSCQVATGPFNPMHHTLTTGYSTACSIQLWRNMSVFEKYNRIVTLNDEQFTVMLQNLVEHEEECRQSKNRWRGIGSRLDCKYELPY
ncbi:hypothetical protein CEXT_589081 [Caerostris extrusa]|uniref:Uncharacterized protein n=1 Tax=Caerostris extrusa TaxID=172846 RepID=A0AAV4UJD5_CAEEX|nr:hypothetical protein CEXT_589081 [Caerostris extrusa]